MRSLPKLVEWLTRFREFMNFSGAFCQITQSVFYYLRLAVPLLFPVAGASEFYSCCGRSSKKKAKIMKPEEGAATKDNLSRNPATIVAGTAGVSALFGKERRDPMWKMQKTSDSERLVLKISGRIEGEELFELERALVSLDTRRKPIELDLQDVKLVDQEVVTFLMCLEEGGTALHKCPPYIREWIEREKAGHNRNGNH